MPGARRTRSRACSVESTRVSHHRYTASTGIPCAMVLTGSFVLSLVIGLCCHHRRPRCRSIVAHLTSASKCQDHTTSPSALAPLVLRSHRVHRIPPNVRDDGQRPSLGRDGRSCRSDLPDVLSGIFLQAGLDSPNQIEAPRQIKVLAHAISMVPRSRN